MRHAFIAFSFLLVLVPLAALGKNPSKNVTDPTAFAKIHSYCIDTRNLTGDEALGLKGFIESESEPKQLLSKMPWQRMPECSEGHEDAVVKLEFSPHIPTTGVNTTAPSAAINPSQLNSDVVRAILRVTDETSSKVVYQYEAGPLSNSLTGKSVNTRESNSLSVQRQNATYAAFWRLIQDIKH